MENNQQNSKLKRESQRSTSTSQGQDALQPLSKPNESTAKDQFAKTKTAGEHHSESSKPEGENETLGTP